jgi:uncharacterized protein (TIGR02391 family)
MEKLSSKKSRPWEIKDLYNRKAHLRAVPILFLEKWEKEKGSPSANRMTTDEITNELVARGVLAKPMAPKGAANLVAGLCQKQRSRDLHPILAEPVDKGLWRFNMSHYETLLRGFRDLYPLMETGAPPTQPRERVVITKRPDVQTQSLENKILQVVREYEGAWEERLQDADNRARSLEEENQKLKAELDAFKAPKRMIVDEELRNDCAEFLEREDTYVDAIRRAGVVLEERLKKAIGGDGPEKFKQGVDLVDYALRKDSGQLIVSEHPADQEGVHMLFRGAVQFVRNPPSHKKMRYTEVEAAQAIGLIDYLLLLLRQVRRSRND